MKQFALPPGTRVKLTKATPRKEFNGENKPRQAMSLRLQWACSGDHLAELHPNLQDMLLWRPPQYDAQAEIAGVPAIKPCVRVPIVKQPLKLELEFTGYTLTIPRGIGDPLELYTCTLSKFEVEAVEGGSASISWSVASNVEITPELVGALCDLEGGEIEISQVPPVPGEAIDGSTEAFERDHPLFDQDPEDTDSEGGETDATSAFVDAHAVG